MNAPVLEELEAEVVVWDGAHGELRLERRLDLHIVAIRCTRVVFRTRLHIECYIVLERRDHFADVTHEASVDRKCAIGKGALEPSNSREDLTKCLRNFIARHESPFDRVN